MKNTYLKTKTHSDRDRPISADLLAGRTDPVNEAADMDVRSK